MKRNRFIKTISTLLFAVVLLLAVSIPVSAAATCNHTLGESISWLESNIGKKLDADGVYPGQCVDLVMKYYDYLVGNHSGVSGNANQYATNKVPAGFTRIKYVCMQTGITISLSVFLNSRRHKPPALFIKQFHFSATDHAGISHPTAAGL